MPSIFNRVEKKSDSPPSSSPAVFSSVSQSSGNGKKKSIFDRMKAPKEQKDIEQEEAEQILAKQRSRSERPVKAFTRGTVEGGLGSYGNVASLVPGYKPGRVFPGEQALIEREASLLSPEKEREFAEAVIAHAAESDVGLPARGTLPTSSQIDKFLELAGIPKEEEADIERYAGRVGRIYGGSEALGLPLGLKTSAISGLGGHLVEEAGGGPIPQALAEIGLSLKSGKVGSKAAPTKIKQPRIVTKDVPPEKAGTISSARQKAVVEKLDKQAVRLSEDVVKDATDFKKISAEIEKKSPIQENFNKFFDNLENFSHEANVPLRDVKPLNDFLAKEARLYEATGAPTFMSKLINQEINGWRAAGKDELYSLYRRYRLNNRRIREIMSDPTFPFSERKEAIGFFTRMNEAITGSLERSLPEDSQWLKLFKSGNESYSNYLNTLEVKRILDPLMKGDLTNKQLTRTLESDRFWRSAERILEPQKAQELRTVLTDLQQARNAIMSMKESPEILNSLLKYGLTKQFIGDFLSKIMSVPKMIKWGMGRYYSSPEFDKNLKEFLKAFSENNAEAIASSINKLSKGD